jgi:hypothetical protein
MISQSNFLNFTQVINKKFIFINYESNQIDDRRLCVTVTIRNIF